MDRGGCEIYRVTVLIARTRERDFNRRRDEPLPSLVRKRVVDRAIDRPTVATMHNGLTFADQRRARQNRVNTS